MGRGSIGGPIIYPQLAFRLSIYFPCVGINIWLYSVLVLGESCLGPLGFGSRYCLGPLGFGSRYCLGPLGFGSPGFWVPWVLGPLGFGSLGFWVPWVLGYCVFVGCGVTLFSSLRVLVVL